MVYTSLSLTATRERLVYDIFFSGLVIRAERLRTQKEEEDGVSHGANAET